MRIHHLEIVTREVDAVCAAYAAAGGARFGAPAIEPSAPREPGRGHPRARTPAADGP